MKDTPSTSGRSGSRSVKTYVKRNRSAPGIGTDADASDSANVSTDDKPLSRAKSTSKTADRALPRSPRKVEVHLPGPSPRRPRPESASVDQVPIKRAPRSSTPPRSPSVSSVHTRSPSARPFKPKPAFKAAPATPAESPASKLREEATPDNADDDDDDNASVAGSVRGAGAPRRKKTAAERRQFFAAQPTCGAAEAHRAWCRRCDAWIPLTEKTQFAMRPWIAHVKACEGEGTGVGGPPDAGAPADDNDIDDAASVAGASIISGSERGTERAARRSEPQRRAILEADPRAEEVGAHEVLCRACQRRIRLAKTQRYALANWTSHQQRCSGSVPSSRVAAVERRMKLVNDAQAKTFTASAVECDTCGASVPFGEDGEYDLTDWDAHKITCPSSPRSPRTGMSSAAASPLRAVAPAARADSPDPIAASLSASPMVAAPPTLSGNAAPAAAAPAAPSPVHTPMKRGRDADGDAPVGGDGADAAGGGTSRVVRPRNAGYVPPAGEVHGMWDWVMLPWRTFVRGFREGARA